MIIQPKVRGFICTTAHPDGLAQSVKEQIEFVKSKGEFSGYKKVLVIGASMGYGLASRIALAFGAKASTIGVIFDRESSGNRTASAGWYNTASFESEAKSENLYAKTINGDAFSKDIKDQTIALIKKDLGKVDAVIYSLASPKRVMADGTVYNSVLKTTDEPYTNKSIDLRSNQITSVTIDPASQAEVDATVKVMGGEDWQDWIVALKEADAIEEGALTVAYSYIGPSLTHAIYYNGSIGMAKQHMYDTAKNMSSTMNVNARVAVNKALVTQSSSAIPIVPLYISILYKVMKKYNLHEDCIMQMQRLFAEKIGEFDENGHIRMDDYEMGEQIQAEVADIWEKIDNENLTQSTDLAGYQADFLKLFGFGFDGVDYQKDTDPAVAIDSLK